MREQLCNLDPGAGLVPAPGAQLDQEPTPQTRKDHLTVASGAAALSADQPYSRRRTNLAGSLFNGDVDQYGDLVDA